MDFPDAASSYYKVSDIAIFQGYKAHNLHRPVTMPLSVLSTFLPHLLCALSWAMSLTPCMTTSLHHTSYMLHWDNPLFNPPPLTYTWPPLWLTTSMLPPGQEAIYAACQLLLKANGQFPSTLFPSHLYPPPLPPHLRPATTALPSGQ